MTYPVIPPPVRFDTNEGHFRLRPGTRVACTTSDAVPIAERFCAEMRRRCGLHLVVTGDVGSDEPGVRIEVASGDKLGVLRVPQGVSPSGDGAPDERYMLLIGSNGAVLRAAEQWVLLGIDHAHATPFQPRLQSIRGRRLCRARTSSTIPGTPGGGSLWTSPALCLRPNEVRRVIDLLALYKLNVLHLHLNLRPGLASSRGSVG